VADDVAFTVNPDHIATSPIYTLAQMQTWLRPFHLPDSVPVGANQRYPPLWLPKYRYRADDWKVITAGRLPVSQTNGTL